MYWPVLVRPTSAAVNIYIPLTTFSPNESKQHILFYDLQPFNKLANTLRWPPCRGLGSYRSFRNLAQQMQNKCKKKYTSWEAIHPRIWLNTPPKSWLCLALSGRLTTLTQVKHHATTHLVRLNQTGARQKIYTHRANADRAGAAEDSMDK